VLKRNNHFPPYFNKNPVILHTNLTKPKKMNALERFLMSKFKRKRKKMLLREVDTESYQLNLREKIT
jgi:hypothetical protein